MQMPSAIASVAFRPVTHDARMSAVDHLDELRSRLIVSLIAVAVAFGFCFWQNHQLLHLINSPLAHQTQAQVRDGHGPLQQDGVGGHRSQLVVGRRLCQV